MSTEHKERVERAAVREEEEHKVLTAAVKSALHVFMEVAQNDEELIETRIDAASRILGYAAQLPFVEEDVEEEGVTGGDNEST